MFVNAPSIIKWFHTTSPVKCHPHSLPKWWESHAILILTHWSSSLKGELLLRTALAHPAKTRQPLQLLANNVSANIHTCAAKKLVTSAVASCSASDLRQTLWQLTAFQLCSDLIFILEHYRELLTSCLQLATISWSSELCHTTHSILALPVCSFSYFLPALYDCPSNCDCAIRLWLRYWIIVCEIWGLS